MGKLSIYIEIETLDQLDIERKRIGFNLTRSQWISQACKDKISQESRTAERIVQKLEAWYRSFPKKPFKEIIEEVKNNGAV